MSHQKVAIVTGANSGIGLEITVGLYRENYHVILACRNDNKAQEAIQKIRSENPEISEGKLESMTVDMSDMESIRNFVENFQKKNLALNLLVLNAGVGFMPYMETASGLESMCRPSSWLTYSSASFAVNYLGNFHMTTLLLETIIKSAPARIVLVSGNIYSYGKLEFQGDDLVLPSRANYGLFATFAMSKLAAVVFVRELARRLNEQGIKDVTVNTLHPGIAKTELERNAPFWLKPVVFLSGFFMKAAKQAAETVLYLCLSEEVKDVSGEYFEEKVRKNVAAVATDQGKAEKLWNFSEKLIKKLEEEGKL